MSNCPSGSYQASVTRGPSGVIRGSVQPLVAATVGPSLEQPTVSEWPFSQQLAKCGPQTEVRYEADLGVLHGVLWLPGFRPAGELAAQGTGEVLYPSGLQSPCQGLAVTLGQTLR